MSIGFWLGDPAALAEGLSARSELGSCFAEPPSRLKGEVAPQPRRAGRCAPEIADDMHLWKRSGTLARPPGAEKHRRCWHWLSDASSRGYWAIAGGRCH